MKTLVANPFIKPLLIFILFILLLLVLPSCSQQVNHPVSNTMQPLIALKYELDIINKIDTTKYKKYTPATREKIANAIKLANQFYSKNIIKSLKKPVNTLTNYHLTVDAVREAIEAVEDEDEDINLGHITDKLDRMDKGLGVFGSSQSVTQRTSALLDFLKLLKSI